MPWLKAEDDSGADSSGREDIFAMSSQAFVRAGVVNRRQPGEILLSCSQDICGFLKCFSHINTIFRLSFLFFFLAFDCLKA